MNLSKLSKGVLPVIIGIVKKNLLKKALVFYAFALLAGLVVFGIRGGGPGRFFY